MQGITSQPLARAPPGGAGCLGRVRSGRGVPSYPGHLVETGVNSK